MTIGDAIDPPVAAARTPPVRVPIAPALSTVSPLISVPSAFAWKSKP